MLRLGPMRRAGAALDTTPDQTGQLLRRHLREIATRQVYHSLYATSVDDATVAAHLRSLAALTPDQLGVKKRLAEPALWKNAATQLKAIDGVTTPAAALRCVCSP
jgi:hypothetical protein